MKSVIFSLTLRQAMVPRKLALLIVFALLPIGLAALLSSFEVGEGEIIGNVMDVLVVSVVLPLVVIVLASSSFGDEVEDRTLSLLTTKPIPRWTIVLAKYTAILAVAGPLMIVTAVLVVMMDEAGTGKAALAAGGGMLAGVAAYGALFMWGGLVTTRALGFGLIYVLPWEALLTGLLSGARYLSVRSYAVGTMKGLDEDTFSSGLAIDFSWAAGGAVVVTLLFFLLTVRRLRKMDIP